jgi:hypothetical protein
VFTEKWKRRGKKETAAGGKEERRVARVWVPKDKGGGGECGVGHGRIMLCACSLTRKTTTEGSCTDSLRVRPGRKEEEERWPDRKEEVGWRKRGVATGLGWAEREERPEREGAWLGEEGFLFCFKNCFKNRFVSQFKFKSKFIFIQRCVRDKTYYLNNSFILF